MDEYWKNLTPEQYFNEWLGIWNTMCLTNAPYPHFIPNGSEPNYKQAKEISDYLSEDLMNIPI